MGARRTATATTITPAPAATPVTGATPARAATPALGGTPARAATDGCPPYRHRHHHPGTGGNPGTDGNPGGGTTTGSNSNWWRMHCHERHHAVALVRAGTLVPDQPASATTGTTGRCRP